MSNENMSELEILTDVVNRLKRVGIQYMLSGSVAMNFYTIPRMTRDIDIILLIGKNDVDKIISLFCNDYYIDKDMVTDAINNLSMFNIIHLKEIIKIDFIIRKNSEYRIIEFNNRKSIKFNDEEICIVSIEDLIISKLDWAKDSVSDTQLRDIFNLCRCRYDKKYVEEWVKNLGLSDIYNKALNNGK